MPRSQSTMSGLPSRAMYSADSSHSSIGRRHAALQQHRDVGAADLAEQVEVLHVAGAELDHVGDLEDVLELADVHELGHDRQAGLLARLGQDLEARLAQALEGVRARCAACRPRRAGRSRRRPCRRAPRRGSARATRPRRARRSGRRRRRRSAGRRPRPRCRGRGSRLETSLYGLRIGTTFSTPGSPSRLQRRDERPVVADRADDRDELAARGVRLRARLLDALDDVAHLLLGGALLHHDHHGGVRPGRLSRGAGAASWARAERNASFSSGVPMETRRNPRTAERRAVPHDHAEAQQLLVGTG